MLARLKLLPTAARKVTSHMTLVGLVAILVGFMALFLWQSIQIQKMQTEAQHKREELAQVQARTDRLQDHLDFYKGPGYLLYVEAVARQALGLVKPGETVVLVVPDSNQPQAATSQPTAISPNAPPSAPSHKSNWQNWLDFFVGT